MRRFILAAATLAALAILAPTAQAGCYDSTGCTDTAKSALSFKDSVGVNTKLGFSDTVYWQQWPMIKDRLLELGVSHIRDGTYPANYPDAIGPTTATRFRELNTAGIKGNLLVGHEQHHAQGEAPTTLQQRLDWIKNESLSPFVIGLEGTNEHYIGVDGPNDWTHDQAAIDSLRAMQCDIHNRVKTDPVLGSKTVVGPAGGAPFYEDKWWFHVAYDRGDLTACMDKGNLHPYPGNDPPHLHQERGLDWASAWSDHLDVGKPEWITEDGYWNASGLYVSETAAGIYVPRMFMETFRQGYERTQAYELIDMNTASGTQIDSYGLLRTDGTRKPAFTATANLMEVLQDTQTASGALNFGIVCTADCHSPIRHVLLRHSDGSYYLAAWSESRVWDNNTDTPQPAQSVNLNLGEAPGQVDVYTTSSTTPFRTETDGATTIATQITDGVRLFKITPAPPTTMSFEAEGMAITPWFPDVYPEPGVVQTDATASANERLLFRHFGEGEKAITTSSQANRVTVRAYGETCQAAPKMTLKVDGVSAGQQTVSASSWTDYTFTIPLAAAGQHTAVLSYDNDYEDAGCNRNLFLDKVTYSYVDPGPTLVFEDNFDGSAVNTTNWSMYHSPGHAGNGLRRPSAFSVANGQLKVTASWDGTNITSGGMAHRTDYTYAIFEGRVRTEVDPTAQTSGLLLTWPGSGNWPFDGELDFYETGHTNGATRNPFYSYLHHYGATSGSDQTRVVHEADGSDWHIMRMEWGADEIRVYRDGVYIGSVTDDAKIPSVEHHLCIQLDAFSNNALAGPVSMYVDWVRIYQ